jgi:GNAT superfamily N-acetyltransferase
MVRNETVALRPARIDDFDFCLRLYLAGLADIATELGLDLAAQAEGLGQRWNAAEVEIITLGDADVGWMHSLAREDSLLLAQIFLDAAFQRRGIGTEILHRLIDRADRAGQPLTLGVAKTNPARELYRRLGFHVTHEDDRRFYMRREGANFHTAG